MRRLETRRVAQRPALRAICAALAAFSLWSAAFAQGPALSPALESAAFLVGSWVADPQPFEGGRTIRGDFTIEPVTGGHALLRRDHTDVADATGTLVESFDQIMLIYPEASRLRADYFDGTHAIHYVDVSTDGPKSIRFMTAASPQQPSFRLTYRELADSRVSIQFDMALPGQSEFRTLAQGTARRR